MNHDSVRAHTRQPEVLLTSIDLFGKFKFIFEPLFRKSIGQEDHVPQNLTVVNSTYSGFEPEKYKSISLFMQCNGIIGLSLHSCVLEVHDANGILLIHNSKNMSPGL